MGIHEINILREKVRPRKKVRFKEKRKKTQSWPGKQERKHDLDQEKKRKKTRSWQACHANWRTVKSGFENICLHCVPKSFLDR